MTLFDGYNETDATSFFVLPPFFFFLPLAAF